LARTKGSYMKNTDTFYSYLAGFFDGEGSIHIRIATKKNKKGSHSNHIRMSISNNNRKVLKFLISGIGFGHITERRRKHKKRSGEKFKINPCSLIITGSKAKDLLKKILPFLIIKKEQARLCLKYPILKQGCKPSEKIKTRRLELRRKVHILNMRDNERKSSFKEI